MVILFLTFRQEHGLQYLNYNSFVNLGVLVSWWLIFLPLRRKDTKDHQELLY